MTELTTFHFVVVQQVCRNCCNLFSLAVDPLFFHVYLIFFCRRVNSWSQANGGTRY